MDWLNAVAGLFVGMMVGLTGVGGGSLMAPVLILIIGVAPTTAVGTDLWFAAITKTVGGLVHYYNRRDDSGPDFQIIGRLCLGSLPAALLVLLLLAVTHSQQVKSGAIIHALGVVLILTGVVTLFRHRIHALGARMRATTSERFLELQPSLTIGAGGILGALVTLTSVGAGAIGATMLLALYPIRMRMQRLVATDIVHAVPLTVVAGLGHFWMGNVNSSLLVSLLIGSIPGIILGSLLVSRAPEIFLRQALAFVIACAGIRLVLG